MQIAIINLQTWCSKWRISINTMKTTYMIFYNKKNTLSSPPIPLSVNGTPLKKVSSQRVLGIIIDEELTFTPYIEYITSRSKEVYNRLTEFPDMQPGLAFQIFKPFIRSKLEYGSIIWGLTVYTDKHRRFLEAAQKSALMLVLRTMKSIPTEALESELNIVPIGLRLEELQRMEAIKLLQKNHQFITNNMGKQVNSKKLPPLTHLGHQAKQVLTVLSKHQNITINAIQIPSEIPRSMEMFYIPNLSATILTKFSSGKGEKNYVTKIQQDFATNTMVIFTDGSDIVIKNPGHYNSPIKLAKVITSCGTSYEGEIEAIKVGTDYAFHNIGQANSLFIYIDSQPAIKAIMAQSRESYNNETITKIRDNLIQISSLVEYIKLIYCPAHKGMKENEISDNLAKTASKNASHLPPRAEMYLSKVKEINRQITLDKLGRRCENSNFHKYKQSVPVLCKNSLRHRLLQLKETTRKGASKVLRLKTGHCMLNQHKSKLDQDTQPKCEVCLVNETPAHYLLHCIKFDTQRAELMKNISHGLRKNSLCPFNVSTEELLGEHNLNAEGLKTLRVELEKYFHSTIKEI